MMHLRANDPEGPNEWWARNIMRIQRENPNYCTEKMAVFRTQRCREHDHEEILQVRHPTRGYMVQDVCKRCIQQGRRGTSVRRKREDSDDEDSDDEDDEPEPEPAIAFVNRRQRALPANELVPDRAFVNQMQRDGDPQAEARAARLAAIERRRAQPAPAPAQPAPVPAQAPPHPPVGVHARALIAQARLEAAQRRNDENVREARRRALRRSMDERRERDRRKISGRGGPTRFGGMVIFSNNQKNTKTSSKKKTSKKSKKTKARR